ALSPKLQKEIERGIAAIHGKNYAEARQHLLKANKLAPSNADVEYLLGVVEYADHEVQLATSHFEKALSLVPEHEKSLISLGQIQLEAQPEKAKALLEKAVSTNNKNSQSHLLLALCNIRMKKFSQAREEALTAADLDKGKSTTGRLIAAKTFVMENNLEEASKAFSAFLRDYPGDKAAPEAKRILERIGKATPASSPPVDAPLVAIQPVVALAPEWAPRDIDEKIPAVAQDVTCATAEIVNRVQARSRQSLANLERFGAKERVDHQEIDASGNPGPIRSRDFEYTILIQRPSEDFYFIDESRDGGDASFSFPTTLITRGLISLGIYIFHPVFSGDFAYSCEGLGQWAGHAAWQLHFEQKADVASRIRSWSYQGKLYPVPLKGRVWISPNTFDILRLETDLRNPVKELQ